MKVFKGVNETYKSFLVDIILLFMIQNTQVEPCCIIVYGKTLDIIYKYTFEFLQSF